LSCSPDCPSRLPPFLQRCAVHRALPSFPTRRSSDLQQVHPALEACLRRPEHVARQRDVRYATDLTDAAQPEERVVRADHLECTQDRKSTRLNSSHVKISYAVFCLKKKTHE